MLPIASQCHTVFVKSADSYRVFQHPQANAFIEVG
jgi:hypothetical protein